MNFLLQTVLSDRYQFLPVSDVYAGMNELKRRDEITLIIIDLDYHTQENLDFVQHIQTSGIYQDIPVIILRSDDNAGLYQKEDLSDRYDFFYKPFSPIDLVSRINELVYQNYIKLT
jgi:two-component system, chemotaxis family, chemotaxis protein CheY